MDAGVEHVGPQGRHAVEPGVGGERLRRVEPHRLRAQQRREERTRVVQLEPRAGVDDQAEADGVALGEAEVGERLDAVVDVVGEVAGDAVPGHAVVERLAQPFDPLDAALGAHRPAQQVRVVARAPADGHGDLHELLLEQRHPERPLQHRLEHRMLVRDRLAAGGAPDVRVHRAALDRAGADERDLDDEVVEAARLEPGQRADLGPALDLEDADRVGPAQHVVDARLLLGDGGQRPRLARSAR